MDQPKIKIVPITDLTPDQQNANLGTARGLDMLETSIQQYGHGRAGLIDRDGNIIAGNKFYGKAGELGAEEVVVVESDGTRPIFIQRTDVSIDEEDGRMLAYLDNRVSELDLQWYPQQISADLNAGLPLTQVWTPTELLGVLGEVMPVSTDPEKRQMSDYTYTVVATCKDEDDMHQLMHHLLELGYTVEADVK